MPRGSAIRRGRSGGAGIPRGSKSDNSKVEQKDAGTVIENVDETKGIVEAVVSVTGLVDSVDDIIEPGAYEKTLQDRTPKGVWSHSWSEPISKTLDIKEILPGDSSLPEKLPNGEPWPSNAGALWVKTQFNLGSPRGQQAFSDVKFFGDDGSWSIGYKAKKATKDAKTGVRRIKELDLFEYSPVLHGANAHAKTLSVKTLDEAKAALTGGGYDVSGLQVKDANAESDFEALKPSEVKDLVAAYDILGSYLEEIGVKRSTVVDGDPDLELPDEGDRWVGGEDEYVPMSLVEELEQLLDPDDFSELLEIAAEFDDAADDGDDEAAGEIMQSFLDVFEEEEEADPELGQLRDVIADVIDDRYPELAEVDEDDDEYDDDEDEEEYEDEYESDDESDDEYESDEGDYDGDAEEAEPTESVEVSGGEKSALPSMGWADSADLVVSSIEFD